MRQIGNNQVTLTAKAQKQRVDLEFDPVLFQIQPLLLAIRVTKYDNSVIFELNRLTITIIFALPVTAKSTVLPR